MEPDVVEALSQLRDVHAPEPISWWPLGPGWWVLAATTIVVLVLVLGLRYWRKKYALRKAVLTEFELVKSSFADQQDRVQLASQLSILIRRVALMGPNASRAAGLKSDAWLLFLDETSDSSEFSQGLGQVLIDAPYQKQADYDAEALLLLSEAWLIKNS